MDLRLARFLGVFAIAMLSLVLGYIGLNEYLSHQIVPQCGTGWADILFCDLQLLVEVAKSWIRGEPVLEVLI